MQQKYLNPEKFPHCLLAGLSSSVVPAGLLAEDSALFELRPLS